MDVQTGRGPGPQAFTYHCLCSQLLLASAATLDSRKQRGGEGLDNAFIVPVMPASVLSSEDTKTGGNSSDAHSNEAHIHDASVLLNTVLERKPVVVRRADGFEVRYQRRCGRCDLVVGYHVDEAQLGKDSPAGRFDRTVYILPGALTTTSDMLKDPS